MGAARFRGEGEAKQVDGDKYDGWNGAEEDEEKEESKQVQREAFENLKRIWRNPFEFDDS